MNVNSETPILVLDDEPFMLKLLARLLSNLGFSSVLTCDNGQTALTLVDDAATRPRLILCDLNMPGMDGVEFVRKLVEHGYTGSLILVSGEDERTLHSAAKLVQAHHIEVLGSLHKPVSQQALSTLMGNWAPTVHAAQSQTRKGYGAERLSQAIHQGELLNFYQPKVSVATAEVVGVETLVRWRHPEDGMVLPDQFIGVAEAHGLIDALTDVVLVQALQDAAVWSRLGLMLKVAVNVSVDNLTVLEFPEFVTAQAVTAGVAPQVIVLEVTESQLMKDLRAPLEILTRLRMRRFKLSIDDFGTGHSSLAQLRDVPFDELKIDQSFVHGAHSNETTRAIFFASLHLAKELGMEVVAEGVEDQADWEFLQNTGCDVAQGYYIARPMPAGELPAWIAAWSGHQSLARLHQSTVVEPVKPVVLVVDDDEFQHMVVAKILGRDRYQLFFASGGDEAFRFLLSTSVDLILMDMQMPDLDGLDITRRLKAMPLLARVPVLMMSGGSQQRVVEQCLQAGAADFVAKPLDRLSLTTKVARLSGLPALPRQPAKGGAENEKPG